MSKLLNAKETAELLGVKESTIRKWVLERKIPFVKVGALVRFNSCDIEAIQAKRIEPREGNGVSA